MARCLVSGGAGFIGSHTVDLLIEQGHEVVILDNLSTGKIENVNPKALFIPQDIRNFDLGSFVPEYIIHTAALARIQPSIDDPRESNDVNVQGTLNLLQFAKKVGAKFIFSSSSSIYGDTLPTKETSILDPKNPYALQKLTCEKYIKLYRDLHGLDYVMFRYFNVFGERQILDGAYAAVVGIFLQQRAEGKKLTITGDGKKRRDFTYVKDVARANVMGLRLKRGVYNVGTGKNNSILELAQAIGEYEHIAERPGETFATQADNSKLVAEGWKPTTSIMEWINEQNNS